jgi:hypothetical protein
MSAPQAHITIEDFFLGPGSAVRFSDDQTGVEVRLLLAGYGEKLTDAVKAHRPIAEIRQIVARISSVLKAGVDHELDLALDSTKPN